MKRKISILLSMLLICTFVLAGCSKGKSASSIAGSWRIVSVSEETTGLELTGEQLESFGMGDYSIEFKEDGTMIATMGSDTTEGSYTVEGSDITVNMDGQPTTGKIEDNKITITDSTATLVLEKEEQK